VSIRFDPLTLDDLPQIDEWLRRPHVARWWPRVDETYEHVLSEYLPAIEGRDPTDNYLIAVDDRPIGMIQTYLVSDYPEWESILHVGAGVAGVDVFIGEDDAVGRGLGTQILHAFISDVVFAREGTCAVVAGIEPENERSLRAFEKAGFRFAFDYEEDGRPHVLLRLERARRPDPEKTA
jgi:aminoglycoside 6'-N-acetyltransferase